MPSGGARLNSGPPPDPHALRRDRPSDVDGWTHLPVAGREGDPPEWPLTEAADRELEVWARLWVLPQAMVWEHDGWTHEVAMYARLLVVAESGSVAAATEARQWSDRLGLNPAALLRLRWKVSGDPGIPPSPSGPSKAVRRRASSRSRLTVVATDGHGA